jgi:hypothetical protein
LRRKVAQTIVQAVRQIAERSRRRRELLVEAIEFRDSLRQSIKFRNFPLQVIEFRSSPLQFAD